MVVKLLPCNSFTCIASKRGESRGTTRGASAGACREHAQVGSMIDVKCQSTWSASRNR